MRSISNLSAVAVSMLILQGAVTFVQAGEFIESFDGDSNVGGWSWGTGNEEIVPLNGHPGAYLQDLTLSSCCPSAFTAPGTTSVFTGDYRDRGVNSVGVDLITLDASFGVGGRPLSVILSSDRGTPFNFEDDWLVYFVGDKDIPDPGVPMLPPGGGTPPGWADYHFDTPAQDRVLPEGWVAFSPTAATDDEVWNAVVTDVDVLEFFYGDPADIFLFLSWDVGLDNPRISEDEPVIPGDLDGDGMVGTTDLLALLAEWGDCPDPPAECAADLNGDGMVGVGDLLIQLANWG